MSENNWKVQTRAQDSFGDAEDTDSESQANLEEAIYDSIAKYIIRKFQGYKMEDLIEEILIAKGFTVYHSKPGADGGKDLSGFRILQIALKSFTQFFFDIYQTVTYFTGGAICFCILAYIFMKRFNPHVTAICN